MGFCIVSDVRENQQKFGNIGGSFNGSRFLSSEPFGHGVRIGAWMFRHLGVLSWGTLHWEIM